MACPPTAKCRCSPWPVLCPPQHEPVLGQQLDPHDRRDGLAGQKRSSHPLPPQPHTAPVRWLTADEAQAAGIDLGPALAFFEGTADEVWACTACNNFGVMGPTEQGTL